MCFNAISKQELRKYGCIMLYMVYEFQNGDIEWQWKTTFGFYPSVNCLIPRQGENLPNEAAFRGRVGKAQVDG